MIFLLLHCFPTLTSKCPKGRFVALRFIWENKGADQLRSNPTADQSSCFHYIDSTVPLLPKFQASSHILCLCQTFSETQRQVFSWCGSYISGVRGGGLNNIYRQNSMMHCQLNKLCLLMSTSSLKFRHLGWVWKINLWKIKSTISWEFQQWSLRFWMENAQISVRKVPILWRCNGIASLCKNVLLTYGALVWD